MKIASDYLDTARLAILSIYENWLNVRSVSCRNLKFAVQHDNVHQVYSNDWFTDEKNNMMIQTVNCHWVVSSVSHVFYIYFFSQ